MLERIKKIFNKKHSEKTTTKKIEDLFEQTFTSDIIRFEVGSDIAEYATEICTQIQVYRKEYAAKNGFIFPPVHLLQNDELQENELHIFIQEKLQSSVFLIPNLENIKKEVKTLFNSIYKGYLDEIFTNEFFEKILNKVMKENSWLIWNISCMYTVSDLKKIFINILKQQKSIKNAKYIFEKIGALSHFVSGETLSKIIVEEI